MIEIKIVRVDREPRNLPLPSYSSVGASGMDLLAHCESPMVIDPLGRQAVPTGIMLEVPPDYEAQIRTRSGAALKHGIVCLNSPGTIDSDYRGEVTVVLANLGAAPFTVRPGDRIAQLVIAPVARGTLIEVKSLSSTARGSEGFGSTGQ